MIKYIATLFFADIVKDSTISADIGKLFLVDQGAPYKSDLLIS